MNRFFTTLFLYFAVVACVYSQAATTPTPTPTPQIRETVTVSAGTSQTETEISKTVNLIDAKQLRERSEYSLGDSLRTIPGLRVQQTGGFGRVLTIKSRGLRNSDTALLIDGMRFRDAGAITGDASSFLSDFTHTNAFRLEVLRGSGSSLYGTNAIGGAIDIQSQTPRKGFHGGLTTAFGSLGQKRIRGNVSDGFDKFGYTLGISRTIFSEGIDKDDDANNANSNGRIDYNPTNKTYLSGRFFVSDAYVKLNSSPDTLGLNLPAITSIISAQKGINFVVDANDPDNFQKSQIFNGQFRFMQVFNDNLFFSANYQGSKTKRRNVNGVLGVGFQSTSNSIFEGIINTLETKLDWRTKRNNLTIGYEFETEKYGNEGFSANINAAFFAKAKQRSNTVFVQDLVNFLDGRLQFSGSFRSQFFSLKNPTFSRNNPPYGSLNLSNPPTSYTFDGSASYFVSKTNTKFRFHAGNGYRVPSLYERFGTFYSSFSQSFTALGDPNLAPEKTFAFDGGIEQNFADNRTKLVATYFYTKLNDIVGFANLAPSIGTTTRPFGGYFNTKGGVSRGAEFSGDFRITNTTSLFTSYTYTNSDQLNPQVANSRITRTLGVPSHQFSLVASQYIGKRFFVNLDFVASSEYLAPIFSNSIFQTRIYSFKGNRKADATASYEIPSFNEKLKWRFFGTVENLFAYEYFENGFQTAGRTGKIGLSLSF
jgi:vitamin B12 transporter